MSRPRRRLLGARRYRVRGKDAEGHAFSIVVLGNRPPAARSSKVLGELLTFSDQEDGTMHVVSRELVVEVVIEQADRYGDWHRVGTWPE